MPYQHLYARAESPRLDLVVDMGNPILNSTVNGFLKVGPVGATHAASQEAFKMFTKESVTKRDLEALVKKAGREGLQWGLVAGSTQVWGTAFIACGGGGTGRTQPWGVLSQVQFSLWGTSTLTSRR